MAQVNRYIRDNPALDDVDHALGRPYKLSDTNRNHYATDCPEKMAELKASNWWNDGAEKFGMTFFCVSDEGRKALADELADTEKYGRLYSITYPNYEGETLVFAKTRSQARYHSWVKADLDDWSFIQYCNEISVRLAA